MNKFKALFRLPIYILGKLAPKQLLTIADLRKNYTIGDLTEADADANPFKQFQKWFDDAVAAKLVEPNAITIATSTPDGKPSARMVLLKAFDERGFVFYTNYQSQKGQQLAENPWGAMVFWWAELERQVRIEGKIEKVTEEESDEYFRSRPWESRLGAWVSNQSQVISNREELEKRLQEYLGKFSPLDDIPRPPHWGGYRLIPSEIEFWQGRPSRLHDRLRYKLTEDGHWLRERLCP